jgi:hypothetical protein
MIEIWITTLTDLMIGRGVDMCVISLLLKVKPLPVTTPAYFNEAKQTRSSIHLLCIRSFGTYEERYSAAAITIIGLNSLFCLESTVYVLIRVQRLL